MSAGGGYCSRWRRIDWCFTADLFDWLQFLAGFDYVSRNKGVCCAKLFLEAIRSTAPTRSFLIIWSSAVSSTIKDVPMYHLNHNTDTYMFRCVFYIICDFFPPNVYPQGEKHSLGAMQCNMSCMCECYCL